MFQQTSPLKRTLFLFFGKWPSYSTHTLQKKWYTIGYWFQWWLYTSHVCKLFPPPPPLFFFAHKALDRPFSVWLSDFTFGGLVRDRRIQKKVDVVTLRELTINQRFGWSDQHDIANWKPHKEDQFIVTQHGRPRRFRNSFENNFPPSHWAWLEGREFQ